MGYVFNCDGCGDRKDHSPPFMGEFRESFLKTTGAEFRQEFNIGETVTLCESCAREVFLR